MVFYPEASEGYDSDMRTNARAPLCLDTKGPATTTNCNDANSINSVASLQILAVEVLKKYGLELEGNQKLQSVNPVFWGATAHTCKCSKSDDHSPRLPCDLHACPQQSDALLEGDRLRASRRLLFSRSVLVKAGRRKVSHYWILLL